MTRDLRSNRPMCEMVVPSMSILPDAASMMRKRDRVSEDFPAPVRPTTPICVQNSHYLFFLFFFLHKQNFISLWHKSFINNNVIYTHIIYICIWTLLNVIIDLVI